MVKKGEKLSSGVKEKIRMGAQSYHNCAKKVGCGRFRLPTKTNTLSKKNTSQTKTKMTGKMKVKNKKPIKKNLTKDESINKTKELLKLLQKK